jgi:hypothetical protein
MAVRNAYTNLTLSWRVHAILTCYFVFFSFIFAFVLPSDIFAQVQPDYDEVLVFLDVPRAGGAEISAVIRGEELYLPVTDLFDFLKVRNITSPGMETISGFFINPGADYVISRSENFIRYQDKTFNLLPGDLIRTESNLYLRSSYFGKVFGLDCIFNFRNLSVSLKTKLELPYIREMRQEEMRRNLTRLKDEVKADTNIGRSYPLFRYGMADWSVYANEEIKGKSETTINLTLGSMLAGGEANASLYYNSRQPFTEKQQNYLWRRVDNDFKPLRQVMAGKIATHAISTIYNPVIGVQFTNTPTTFRRSFGSYTLSDKTEPGWIVELYVNNVLVDYVKADASGFFTFEVPLVYGNSIVQLKFFGPWGEERAKQQNVNIPYNFLPKNTMEYTVSAGVVEDSSISRFSRASINYGVSRSLTVGGGMEYLSSVKSGPAMPYISGSFSLLKNLLLSGQYYYGVGAKGTLNYRLPSNMQFDLNYTKYDKNQTAINYNYLEERKAVLSLPLKIGKFSSYQRFSLYQIVLPSSDYTTGEWLFSGSIFGVNTNLTTSAYFLRDSKPYIYSNLSLAFRLPASFVVMPHFQYEFTDNKFLSAKVSVEKPLLEHGFLNCSFEQIIASNIKLFEAGFRYDFSFAQTGASVRQNDKKTSLIQYARGSLIKDRQTKYLGTDNRFNVGKGGISIIPYLDLNANGIKDPGEPKVSGLNLRTNGGRIEKSESDTTIRILGLEPYTNCFIDLDPNSFDNVAWKLPVRTLSVSVDPNILKHIELPVTVAGEATGMVALERYGEKKGLGRIILSFYGSNKKLAGKTLSEEDGYFSYLGLAPGSYSVRIDTTQLRKLGMKSDPQYLSFDLASKISGDVADGLNFTLQMLVPDTLMPEVSKKPVVRKDTSVMIIHEVVQELVTISEDSYAIQLGAFNIKSNADAMRSKLQILLGRKVEIIVEGGFFKVRISEIKTREEVDKIVPVLQKNGINELWVISLKAKQKQIVLRERQDTITTFKETGPESAAQSGAFRRKANAIALSKRISPMFGEKSVIVFEDDYKKLNIKGTPIVDQSVMDMMKEEEPLVKIGFKDIWLLPVKTPPVEQPPVIHPETIIKPVEWKKEIPLIMKPDATLRITEGELVAPSSPLRLNISLQVGVFTKRSEALRAQRRIKSKLKLPVKITQQWEYYKVIVTGFHTRQETYMYYPELAGLGYPNITLIEEK